MRVVLRLVGASGLAGTLGDVLGDRLGGSAELIHEVAVAFGDALKQSAREHEEFDRSLVHVELLEAEHDRRIGRLALRLLPSTGRITITRARARARARALRAPRDA